MARPGYESDRRRVVVLDWPGGTARVLTEAWDRSPESLAWSADSRRLVTTAANVGIGALNRKVGWGDVAAGDRKMLAKAKEAKSYGS